MSYLKNFSTKTTPQSQPIPGSTQVQNSAGGFSWEVSKWTQLDRFLILGSEGGSYYATEQVLTAENAKNVLDCINEDGPRVVRRVVEVSDRGLAPKNDPALFVLALCSASKNSETRALAFAYLSKVARIGTHLLHFASYMEQFRGWGRGARDAVGRWFYERSNEDLAYQAIKYQSRDLWALADLLRLSHPKRISEDDPRRIILDWIVNGWSEVGPVPHPDPAGRQIWAFERAKRAETEKEIVKLIEEYRLPREAVPTQFLTSKAVWWALLESIGMEAMIRNLGTMSKIGLLTPMSKASSVIRERLQDQNRIRSSRLHPIKLLSALIIYSKGHGEKSDATWTPDPAVIDALNQAFYLAFENVEKTGKRYCLALDISGSMASSYLSGMKHISCRQGAAAMSLVTANVEPNHFVMGFDTAFRPVNISPRQRLDDAVRAMMKWDGGGTDCALPVLWAQECGIEIDNFVIYTDSETWAGHIHPSQALTQYRQKTGINAKMAVVGMVGNKFSIADPNDLGMMDFVGFSTDTPQVMQYFFRG